MRRMFVLTLLVIMYCMLSVNGHAGLNDGLVAYYPFNGNANDESGNGNHGTVYGAVLVVDRFGNSNSAYSFDGVDDYIEILNSPSLNPVNAITISVWYRYSSFHGDGNNALIDKGAGSHVYPYYQYHLGISDETYINSQKVLYPGIIEADLALNDSWVSLFSDANALDYDNWCHIASVYDGSAFRIYLNGELIKSNDTSGVMHDYGKNLIIGSFSNRTSMMPNANHYTKGMIDDIRIYNRALSDTEIQQLYSPVSPANHDYGILAVGWSEVQRFSVTNVRDDTITLGNLSLSGDDVSEFVILNDNCMGAIMAPHEVRTFDVTFTAASLGLKSATVIIPVMGSSAGTWQASLGALVTEICECDLNTDGRCDMRDWLLFGQRWGATNCSTVTCECDLNADGRCDMRDWLRFGQDWGRTNCPVQ